MDGGRRCARSGQVPPQRPAAPAGGSFLSAQPAGQLADFPGWGGEDGAVGAPGNEVDGASAPVAFAGGALAGRGPGVREPAGRATILGPDAAGGSRTGGRPGSDPHGLLAGRQPLCAAVDPPEQGGASADDEGPGRPEARGGAGGGQRPGTVAPLGRRQGPPGADRNRRGGPGPGSRPAGTGERADGGPGPGARPGALRRPDGLAGAVPGTGPRCAAGALPHSQCDHGRESGGRADRSLSAQAADGDDPGRLRLDRHRDHRDRWRPEKRGQAQTRRRRPVVSPGGHAGRGEEEVPGGGRALHGQGPAAAGRLGSRPDPVAVAGGGFGDVRPGPGPPGDALQEARAGADGVQCGSRPPPAAAGRADQPRDGPGVQKLPRADRRVLREVCRQSRGPGRGAEGEPADLRGARRLPGPDLRPLPA